MNKIMNMAIVILGLLLTYRLSFGEGLVEMKAEDVIRQMEDRQVFDSAFVKGRMVINDRFGQKISTFDSWSLGTDNSLIEFTSVEEQGQKVLRSNDDIYIYYPDAEEVVRLTGSALRDGMLGSDVSYEDMTGEKSLLNDYRVIHYELVPLDGLTTYKIELEALRPSVAYQKQIIWINSQTYNGLLAHKFSLSGKLLKVEQVLETRVVGEYIFPVHSKIEDKLKNNTSTEFYIDEIEVNYPVKIDFFSLDQLTW